MTDLLAIKHNRVDEAYLVEQVDAQKAAMYWKDHKSRIRRFDEVYGGFFGALAPEDIKIALEDEPFVENKLRNAAHDIKRLAREAKATSVFTKEGEDDKSATRAMIRSAIADTLWEEGGGKRFEGNLYLDLIRGGFAAVAGLYRKGEDYPTAMRLDPAYAYPTVVNGKLIDMLYVVSMKEREAVSMFPDAGLSMTGPESTRELDVVLYFNETEAIQGFVQTTGDKERTGTIVRRWPHKLGCVPVAYREIDTADGAKRGLLDQLAGPLKARNKAVKLMIDYLEDMVAAPYEEKGIENSDVLPGKTVVYHHDETAEGETFMRRVPPAAPASAVFGLIQYLDTQEASEGYQPASRTGFVRQSQASGSFVESTQGSLSSVVLEMQDYVSDLRHDANVILMKIDEKKIDREKPMIRAVGQKVTYTPSKDVKGWYYHKVQYGAAAGLGRAEGDQRVLQHLGAGLISEGIARSQIDYIESDANVQDDVDRMLLRKASFQKLISDPRVTYADIAKIEQEMGKGKSRYDAVKMILPELVEAAKQQAQAAAGGPNAIPTQPENMEGQPAPEEALALQQGATPGAGTADFSDLEPEPLMQIISR